MLIAARNAMMTGKRLPYDAEVEYLESTGTQWIDTGVLPVNDMEFECKFIFTSLVITNLTIVGSRDSEKRCQPIGVYNKKWSASIGGTYDANGASVSSETPYTISSTITNGQTIITYVNGSQASTCTSTTGLPSQELFIFARNFYGNTDPVDSRVNGRLYFLEIKANGVLVRDLIPVRVGTTGYLYDRVTRKLFGNAGTGDFVLGQDVVPVEYIESHGTEWIDTGVNLASGDIGSISIDGQFTNNTKNEQFNGIYAGFYFGTVNYYNTGSKWSVGGTQVGASDMSRHTFTLTGEIGASRTIRLAIDGSTFTNTRNVAAGKIGLFNIQGQGYYSYMKMWGSSISVNDTPVRKYHPIRVGTEGALMDVLTRRIYRNAGTGAFTYGNDLKYPIPAA